jgi:hypothetical protein
MATEEVIGIKVTTDAAQATADVQKLDKAFTETDDSVKSLRTQMREAQAQVGLMADKFGATSKEAVNAAKKAAELKDRIGDAKALTDAFNPDAKFKAVASSLAGVAGGFSALQGAMALFGNENKDVEKALLKVNAAMALSQGLQAVGESVDSFRQLGAVIKSTTVYQELNNAATKTAAVVQRAFGVATVETSTGFKVLKGAIVATGIGALVVLLGEVINNFDAISDWIKKSPLGALAKGVGELVTQFTDFIGVTSEAERNLVKLSAANKRGNEDIENRIKVLKAQGGSEKEIYELGQQRVENELNTLRESLKTKGKLTDDEAKQFRDLKTEQLVLTADYNKKTADTNKKAAEDAKKKFDETNKQVVADTEKANELLLKMQNEKVIAELKTQEEKDLAVLAQQEIQQLAEVDKLKVNEKLKGELKAAIVADYDAKETELKDKQTKDKAEKDAEKLKVEKDFNNKVSEIKANAIKDDVERAEAQRLVKLEKDLSDLDTDKEFIKKSVTEQAEIKKALIDASELEGQKSKNEIVAKGLQDEIALLQAQQKGLSQDSEAYWKNVNEIEDKSYQAKLIAAKGNAKEIEKIEKEHSLNKQEIAKLEKEAQLQIIKQRINDIQTFGSNLQVIAGKNKKLAIAGLLIEKGAAVADVVMNTAKATTKAVAASPLTLGLPWSALIIANGVLQSVAIIKSAVDGIAAINSAGNSAGISEGSEIGSGGGTPSIPSPGGGGSGGGSMPDLGGGNGGGGAAPDLGGGGGSTGGGGGGGNNAIRAYVVESDISGTQKRVQQIQDQARFE